MKPLLVSSGEPAGIGPDLCLELADSHLPIVIAGDLTVLQARAAQLKRSLSWSIYTQDKPLISKPKHLNVLPLVCPEPVIPGQLNVANATYVLQLLTRAVSGCMSDEFSALVTAPIHKGVLNQAGFAFTGHTEFLREYSHADMVVMLLACDVMKVALATTHLPLKDVSHALSMTKLMKLLECLHAALKKDFAIANPKIAVAGLNPHAGEGGYLGTEEQEVIIPVVHALKKRGMNIDGPFSADTLFTPKYLKKYDVFLTMYHDQGLPVLKYAGFGHATNITLGLPFIRTSVDHGTALDLAGNGQADGGSLLAAINMAETLVNIRAKSHVLS